MVHHWRILKISRWLSLLRPWLNHLCLLVSLRSIVRSIYVPKLTLIQHTPIHNSGIHQKFLLVCAYKILNLLLVIIIAILQETNQLLLVLSFIVPTFQYLVFSSCILLLSAKRVFDTPHSSLPDIVDTFDICSGIGIFGCKARHLALLIHVLCFVNALGVLLHPLFLLLIIAKHMRLRRSLVEGRVHPSCFRSRILV